ncbi:hypothetical protein Tco_0447284, partial [Tanacetum coccineum]
MVMSSRLCITGKLEGMVSKKIVEVDYSWIPCVCSHCKVFGHTDSCCNKKRKVVNEENSVRNN